MITPIVHRLQPTPRSCGQTCLAMILGVSVSDVLLELDGKHGTTSRQLRVYLGKRGRLSHAEQPWRGSLPDLAIVGIRWKRGGHWIVWNGERYFDPAVRDPLYSVRAGALRSFIRIEP